MNTFIYGLMDPRTQQLRYVGKSSNPKRRLKCHLRAIGCGHLACWIASLLRDGVIPEMFTIEEVSEEEWPEAERFWIAYFQYIGADLVNHTMGGRGGSLKGIPKSEEHKRKIGEAHRRENLSEEALQHYSEGQQKRKDAGYVQPPISEAMRQKMSESRRGKNNPFYGKHHSEETRAELSKANRGRKHSDETKRKMSKSHKGIRRGPMSEEQKRKISEAQKRAWADSVKRANMMKRSEQ